MSGLRTNRLLIAVHKIWRGILGWGCLGLWLASTATQAQNSQILLLSFEYPPFVVSTPDGPKGLMVEVVTEAFRRMGRPVRIDLFPLQRDFQLLDIGKAEGMFTVKQTAERMDTYLFGNQPLLLQDYVFFTRKDSKWEFNGDFNSLADARVGMVEKTSFGSVFDAAVLRGAFKHLETSLDFEGNFKKLLGKRVDVVISSRVVGWSILKKLGAVQQVKITGPVVETTKSYLMFTKKAGPELTADFDTAIASMRKDGSLAAMQKKYSE